MGGGERRRFFLKEREREKEVAAATIWPLMMRDFFFGGKLSIFIGRPYAGKKKEREKECSKHWKDASSL